MLDCASGRRDGRFIFFLGQFSEDFVSTMRVRTPAAGYALLMSMWTLVRVLKRLCVKMKKECGEVYYDVFSSYCLLYSCLLSFPWNSCV